MIRFFVYILPVLFNYIIGGIFFITAHRFAAAGAGAFFTTATMSDWGLAYTLISLIAGRITTKENAPLLIIGGALTIALASIGFLLVSGLYWQFVWITLIGAAAAFYCTPFQVFMKMIEPDQSAGTVRATALYTFSWSFGMAAGPFIFGCFKAQTGFIINCGLGILIGSIIYGIKIWRERHPVVVKIEAEAPEAYYAGRPDFVRIGWLVGGIGTMTVAIVRTLVPFRAEEVGLLKVDAGVTLAIVSFVQAFVALGLVAGKNWMYKVLPAVSVGSCGIIALCGFAFAGTASLFKFFAVIYGIYSGCFYFYFVFHSLVHPTKSARYVAGNEVIVGITNVLSPLAGSLLTTLCHASSAPFIACAGLTLFATLIQVWAFAKSSGKTEIEKL